MAPLIASRTKKAIVSESLSPIRVQKHRRKRSRSGIGKVSQTYWAEEQDTCDSVVALEKRLHRVRQDGDFSIAYSTAVQPCLEYFGDEHGYIAFRKRWGIVFVLGDMVAPEASRESLLDRFLARYPRASFCQVRRSTAKLLSQRGFYVNEIGVDTTIGLADYRFEGKSKEWLRYAANWSNRRGFQIVEANFESNPSLVNAVEEVSEAWRKTRTVKRKEVRFLNRPIVLQDELDVRKFFYLSPDGKLLAYVFLDPIYQNGRLVGYVTSIKRRHPDAPIYSEQAIMKRIIETLKAEGTEILKLGLSPLADIQDQTFSRSWLLSKWFKYSFKAGWVNRYFYHLEGHAAYKRRFRGDEEKMYLGSHGFNPLRLFALLSLCGIA